MEAIKAIELCREVKRLNGRCWKSMVRDAWFTGNYSGLNLPENGSNQLQAIRNRFGPSWLVRVKV